MREVALPQGTEKEGPRGRSKRPAPRPADAVRDEVVAALRDADGAAVPAGVVRPRPDKPRVAKIERSVVDEPVVKSRAVRTTPAAVVRQPLPARPRAVEDLQVAFTRALGARAAGKARADLDAAARAFEHDRFTESLRLMARLSKQAPNVPEVRELLGLSLYWMGRWPAAIVELEAFREMSGSAEENAVLMDCFRALRRWSDVEELWEELREASPNPAVVHEGRIVMAGALADRGDLAGGLRLLEKGWRVPSRPLTHHLRRAYAMADLYERSGAPVRARELFTWVRTIDAEFGDVAERLRHLG